MKTQLSIIIPCKNEEKYIGKLLTALTHQELESSTEIIIADANSNDSTRAIINQYKEKR
jgi:glycosyltransferase involved in cell wall biosynthesis